MTGRHFACARWAWWPYSCSSAPAVQAAADRKAPTTPTNLRVTGKTAYTVSFAWGASTDNGSFTYRIVNRTFGTSVVVPSTQTTFTWSASNFNPQQSYSFQIHAVDAANNWSKPSNTVSATLLADTTTPQAPQLSLTDNGPTHLSLAWTTVDDDPTPQYVVYRDGTVLSAQGSTASIIAVFLAPGSTHTFTVQARDSGGHLSPMSAPLIATTEAADPDDHTPADAPRRLLGSRRRKLRGHAFLERFVRRRHASRVHSLRHLRERDLHRQHDAGLHSRSSSTASRTGRTPSRSSPWTRRATPPSPSRPPSTWSAASRSERLTPAGIGGASSPVSATAFPAVCIQQPPSPADWPGLELQFNDP